MCRRAGRGRDLGGDRVGRVLARPPQILWIVRGSPIRAERFFEWAPGWSLRPEPIAWFWFKNTGLFILLLVIALLAPARWVGSGLRRFFLPFLLTFIVPNLFRIAPRIWDNNKMLIYWYVAAAPLVALLLARLWRRGPAARLAVLGLFASLTGSCAGYAAGPSPRGRSCARARIESL